MTTTHGGMIGRAVPHLRIIPDGIGSNGNRVGNQPIGPILWSSGWESTGGHPWPKTSKTRPYEEHWRVCINCGCYEPFSGPTNAAKSSKGFRAFFLRRLIRKPPVPQLWHPGVVLCFRISSDFAVIVTCPRCKIAILIAVPS